MNCVEAKELLSPYFDDELSAGLARDVKQHVEHCPACQAELASFEQLSVAVCSASPCGPAEDNWQRIAARLDEPVQESVGAPESWDAANKSSVIGPAKLRGFQAAAATILALAASLLLIVGLRARMGQTPHDSTQPVASAVDYQDIFEIFERRPQLAMETLSERYQGREVSAEQAEKMLGYRPSISDGLPSQTRLVSTRVLKLPQCKCAGGKCTCGPGECNCAACLCERPDGSKFLVFEQCKTQDITFGDLPFVIARRDHRDVQFIQAHDQLAVSWIKGDRRLTAIGVKDETEAESLIATLGAQHAGS